MLIHDLAVGDTQQADLAEKYDVGDAQVIANFAQRNKHKITEAKQDLSNRMVGLWVQRKELRVACYEAEIDRNLIMIEDIQGAVSDISQSTGIPISPDTDKIMRLQSNIFRALQSVAEETGQLPTRSPDLGNAKVVRHIIEGLENWPAQDDHDQPTP